MTLKQLYDKIALAAASQPNVHQVVDKFDLLNRPETCYASFVIQQQEHNVDQGTFSFYLGYVDMLNADKSNEIDIQSIGIEAIRNVVNYLDSSYEISDVVAGRAVPLTQKFTAECACVYALVTVTVPTTDCYTLYD